ncbi:gag/pol/env polyprotein, putative [Perkinsus marinus ATCC 50983]|uniref:Gag/pol/env polyprotein, putative n=1 Tax=Perkinsus marinus (strain ATCC 50983 / TXsc) TaxID=423536 RepID=C5LE06_PERM5|nr:gag/pol/env polyprotein, putative [Perkinsus marinus ATCC 50983]EER05004.1 gag/pol/env polyprotein, putative [Perkinsus marinus ATCC 50983]|eukprot:XP_002773188.1 gag/pol/env polyprotein, putative [Perkinsus marinus ATCC 50983]
MSVSASLLTATCAFTGFTAIFPISGSFKAKDICDGLSVIFNRHGHPVRLRCDRAKAYLSKYMNDYCQQYGITIAYSTPRSPWTLGWVETRHRVINSTLARLMEGSGRSWNDPVTLSMLENCINSYGLEYEGSENVCPYELMYGFAPCSALQARLRVDRDDPDLNDIETDDPIELVSSARAKATRLDKLHQRFRTIWQDRRERVTDNRDSGQDDNQQGSNASTKPIRAAKERALRALQQHFLRDDDEHL